MGALMNTGKRPLGLVFEILEAQYADDTAAVRRAEVLRIDEWATAVSDWLTRQQPRAPLEPVVVAPEGLEHARRAACDPWWPLRPSAGQRLVPQEQSPLCAVRQVREAPWAQVR